MLERIVYQKDIIQEEIELLCLRKLFKRPHNNKNYIYGVWNILWHMGYYPNVFFDKRVRTVTHAVEFYTQDVEYTDKEKTAVMQLLKTKTKDDSITAEETVIKAIVLWET